jgi:putative ABC transport system ATP-binding protein
MISINAVSKTYHTDGVPVHALRDVSLRIEEGEFVALMGPSGSGKSTLLTVLGAMNPPTTGQVEIDGIEPYALSAERQADFRYEYVGFIFQQLYLVPYLTALQNVMLPLAIGSQSRRAKRQLALEALNQVGLSDKERRLPSQLSGGEQARVAVARALVNHPPLLLADEPTGNLDSATGEVVLALLAELQSKGQTIAMVTHNRDAADHAQRIVHLRDGVIEQAGLPPSQIREAKR